MLTAIENRLEELFQQIETMPADKVAAAEKDKEQERRKKAREMKLERDRYTYSPFPGLPQAHPPPPKTL